MLQYNGLFLIHKPTERLHGKCFLCNELANHVSIPDSNCANLLLKACQLSPFLCPLEEVKQSLSW
jgi:hypothetical protein